MEDSIVHTSNIEDELEADMVHREKNKNVSQAPVSHFSRVDDVRVSMELEFPHGGMKKEFTLLRDRISSGDDLDYDAELSSVIKSLGYTYSEFSYFLQDNIPVLYNEDSNQWELDVDEKEDSEIEPVSIVETPISPGNADEDVYKSIMAVESNLVAGFAEVGEVEEDPSREGVVVIDFVLPYGDMKFTETFVREFAEEEGYPELDSLFDVIGSSKDDVEELSVAQFEVSLEEEEWVLDDLDYPDTETFNAAPSSQFISITVGTLFQLAGAILSMMEFQELLHILVDMEAEAITGSMLAGSVSGLALATVFAVTGSIIYKSGRRNRRR